MDRKRVDTVWTRAQALEELDPEALPAKPERGGTMTSGSNGKTLKG